MLVFLFCLLAALVFIVICAGKWAFMEKSIRWYTCKFHSDKKMNERAVAPQSRCPFQTKLQKIVDFITFSECFVNFFDFQGKELRSEITTCKPQLRHRTQEHFHHSPPSLRVAHFLLAPGFKLFLYSTDTLPLPPAPLHPLTHPATRPQCTLPSPSQEIKLIIAWTDPAQLSGGSSCHWIVETRLMGVARDRRLPLFDRLWGESLDYQDIPCGAWHRQISANVYNDIFNGILWQLFWEHTVRFSMTKKYTDGVGAQLYFKNGHNLYKKI